jgi:magnesium chelatase family protein
LPARSKAARSPIGGRFAARITRPRCRHWSAAACARGRDIQVERYATLGLENVRTNAQAHGRVLEEVARADGTGLALLRDAADSMRLSARGYHRVLRVARTLADLDGAEKVGRVHLAEALSYRALADEVRRAA